MLDQLSVKASRRPPGHLDEQSDVEDVLALSSDRRLLCVACSEPITGDVDRVAVEGRHVHHRTNPAGIDFEFGCFSAAPGAAEVGAATSEHSWFAGFGWRISICRGCGSHLGWRFECESSSFHGLILDRLVAERPGGDAP